ncbi:uncharacterized protein Tco025E_01098 [Trypanosoma conorhini]|uniref:PIN domain-containing protein n=1 Tax=Trypanosoma conorhini TaxID=83891 RepID=A0A3R7PXG2_9TRYP|nr:uncharacterized protein Tco025E_01098 [Trypanosoma conorhini]RNF26700.1 hypothetical protein Tco025E_01098 [Trypanosoma conorhini]
MSLYSGSDSEYFAASDSDAEAGPAPPRGDAGRDEAAPVQQPNCLVVDTSAFLETGIARQLSAVASRHMVIVPTKVFIELQRLSKEEGQKKATEVLQIIQSMEALRNAGNERKGGGGGDCADFAPGLRLQRAKERDTYVLRAARNFDDHILSCACYFARHQAQTQVSLLTCDELLALKAYAEGVPAIKSLEDL